MSLEKSTDRCPSLRCTVRKAEHVPRKGSSRAVSPGSSEGLANTRGESFRQRSASSRVYSGSGLVLKCAVGESRLFLQMTTVGEQDLA